jgi:exportin-1
LQAFLSWIPLNYIFNTDLIENLLNYFIVPAYSRNEAIKCFTEIASLEFKDLPDHEQSECKQRLLWYYCVLIQKVTETIKQRTFNDEYNNVKNTKQQSAFENFARQVALAISAVLKNNI